MSLYNSPGKQTFRELVLAVAEHDSCQSYGTLWGSGIDSRMAVARGLAVIACEKDRSLHSRMDADADLIGYRVWHHSAGRLDERVDMFHADFCGNASPSNFRELRRIAAITDKWLAVTLSPDHQLNESMQGEAALYTVPAWLTGATGFTLEYFGRYVRNAGGTTMFTALLQRREGHGNSHRVQPVQVAYSVTVRQYWASKAMYQGFGTLLPHSNPPESEAMRQRAAEYYQEHRAAKLAASRARYEQRKRNPDAIVRDRANTARWAKSDRGLAWRREYERKRRLDPDQGAKKRAYCRAWYARKKALAVQSTASEALQKAA